MIDALAIAFGILAAFSLVAWRVTACRKRQQGDAASFLRPRREWGEEACSDCDPPSRRSDMGGGFS